MQIMESQYFLHPLEVELALESTRSIPEVFKLASGSVTFTVINPTRIDDVSTLDEPDSHLLVSGLNVYPSSHVPGETGSIT